MRVRTPVRIFRGPGDHGFQSLVDTLEGLLGLPVRAEMKGLDLHQAFLDGVEAAIRLGARLAGRIRASLQLLANGAQHQLDGRGIGPLSDLAHSHHRAAQCAGKGPRTTPRAPRPPLARPPTGARRAPRRLRIGASIPHPGPSPGRSDGPVRSAQGSGRRAGEPRGRPDARSVNSGPGAEQECRSGSEGHRATGWSTGYPMRT